MLFDLRGRGRKNTVRIIYVLLAFLMGGGLVLFGIGGATSGGLVDAITGAGTSSDAGEKRFTKRETAALKRIEANSNDQAAYIDLVRARISLAGGGQPLRLELQHVHEGGEGRAAPGDRRMEQLSRT